MICKHGQKYECTRCLVDTDLLLDIPLVETERQEHLANRTKQEGVASA